MLRAIRNQIEAIRAANRFKQTNADWRAIKARTQPSPLAGGMPKRLIVVPSDPWTLTGAKGDEAMIQAVVSQLKAVNPDLEVGIITGSNVASQAAMALGFKPLQVWRQKLHVVLSAIDAFKADTLAVLGADCMDGYYSADTTLALLAITDLAADRGVRTSILGFSFNDQPSPKLAPAFNAMGPRVAIHVRDEVSLGRFQKFCQAQAQLVTDSAFMLQPTNNTSAVRAIETWASQQRSQARHVIGFNVHPMLLRNPSPDELQGLIDNVANAIEQLMRERSVSVAFISHDYRGASGDDACLKPLYERLVKTFGDRLYYSEQQCTAAELKGMAGHMDGVVTGRMHLAIASLGMGVPVAALTYQDKFQGLMKHFGLPQSLLIPPAQLSTPAPLLALLKHFDDELATYTAMVNNALPAVKAASKKNVAPLLV
jgi:colanic acid/amylovoran biosynthesis protein